MHRVQFATLDTLQHRLAADPEYTSSLLHRYVAGRRLFDETCAQILAETNTPRSTGGELFPGDEAVRKPTMYCRRGNAEKLCCLLDGYQVALGLVTGWLIARDFPIPADATDAVSSKAFPGGCSSSLSSEDAGNHFIPVVTGQATDQLDRSFIGTDRGDAVDS